MKIKLKVIDIKEERHCRQGHRVGDSYILLHKTCEGLCARNKKHFLKNQNKIEEGQIFICPDKIVSFQVDFIVN